MKTTLLNRKIEQIQSHTQRPVEDAHSQCTPSQWSLLLRYTLLHKVQVSFPPSLSLKLQWVTKAKSGSSKYLYSCV